MRQLTMRDLTRRMDLLAQSNRWYEDAGPRPQTPRNLAVSIAIEAAEVLECFQWTDAGDAGDVADELADVILYSVQLANVMSIDIGQALERKLAKNAERTWDDDGG